MKQIALGIYLITLPLFLVAMRTRPMTVAAVFLGLVLSLSGFLFLVAPRSEK